MKQIYMYELNDEGLPPKDKLVVTPKRSDSRIIYLAIIDVLSSVEYKSSTQISNESGVNINSVRSIINRMFKQGKVIKTGETIHRRYKLAK